jgi:Reverse transcriptase (RNA-dependent DNA polymerase)
MLRLIQKWLKAGISEDGQWSETELGTPQGAVVSPLLSNVYLHYIFDLWVEAWRKKVARGDVIVVRYADDLVVGFHDRSVPSRAALFERPLESESKARRRPRKAGPKRSPVQSRRYQIGNRRTIRHWTDVSSRRKRRNDMGRTLAHTKPSNSGPGGLLGMAPRSSDRLTDLRGLGEV